MRTIAIVNNEYHLRASLRIAFEAEGFEVREYANTQDALEVCDNPVDLALLDKTNPPLGGIELFRRIRKRHSMPIIFLSAWATEVREELERAGPRVAQGYIDTPFSQREAIELVRTVLNM